MNGINEQICPNPFFGALSGFFRSYAASFYSDDGEVHTNITLKENHTFRVCKNARDIGQSIPLDGHGISIACIAALLHDIGRFEQYSRYRTFSDARSENHASMALRIIEEKNLLSLLSDADRSCIMHAVACHNMQDIPSGLDERTHLHATILRDADKLDIIPLVIEYLSERQFKKNPGMEAGLPDTPGYSQEIIDLLMHNRTISNRMRKNYNDVKLVQMTWMLDLNFPHSYRTALENGYHRAIAAHLPDDPIIRKAADHIEEVMKERAAL